MHWLNRHRSLILAAIGVFWTGLVVTADFFPTFPFLSNIWWGEQSFQDLIRRATAGVAVAGVAIEGLDAHFLNGVLGRAVGLPAVPGAVGNAVD